jgi:hypothetical protein
LLGNFPDIRLKLSEVTIDSEGGTEATLAVEGLCPTLGASLPPLTQAHKQALRVLVDQFPQGATFTEWLKASGLKRTQFSKIACYLKLKCHVTGGSGSKGDKYYAKKADPGGDTKQQPSTGGTHPVDTSPKDRSVSSDQSNISSSEPTCGDPVGSVQSPSLGGRTDGAQAQENRAQSKECHYN